MSAKVLGWVAERERIGDILRANLQVWAYSGPTMGKHKWWVYVNHPSNVALIRSEIAKAGLRNVEVQWSQYA